MPKAAGEGPCSEGVAVKRTPCEREELLMSFVRWQRVQCHNTFAEGVTLLLLCFMRQWSTSQEGKLQGKTPCCSCVLAGINYKQVGPWCGSHCTRAHAAISKKKKRAFLIVFFPSILQVCDILKSSDATGPECSHIALGCSASRYQLFKWREKSLENTEFSSKPHFSLLQDQWRFPLQWKGEMSISFQYLCCLTAAKDTSVGNSCVEQFGHPGAGGSQSAAVVVSWGCSIFLERPPRTLDNTLRQSLEAPLSQPKGCPPASMKPVTISFP